MDAQQLALAIGKLQGLAEASQLHREALSDDIEKLTTAVSALTQTVQTQVAGLTALTRRVEHMEPDVADWRRTKLKGLGALATAALAGGLVLNFGKDIWTWALKYFQ